ncbi:ASG_G0052810.mRNA.1.CDS.1 [Saccharomyces cerevisiae]|nr:AFI_G0022800.mRNA.1.CDS.1 [Saccharomyces cerevisiae]CAI4795519.1 AIC_G0052610.mRNA.1.CDS.1 [Saccharomyces cerevisiae]CAI4800381.1 CAS_1a_G0052750.mRNA.1.CDS.1 [Saccharomyces cerevisiae]CAI4809822.1 AGK_G0053370.mRNA.1.CDS.1 [Saccharomyces cerevisiae]CAI4809850.1 ASG_G0052810.mRNA.1.CDS.1 [Saccharomyces cerevisiae]
MESKSSTSSSQDGEAKTRQIKDEFVSHISLETRKEPFFEDVSAVDDIILGDVVSDFYKEQSKASRLGNPLP